MAISNAVMQQIAEGYRHDYEEYRDAVLSGARIASEAEKLKVMRQERMLSEGVEGYIFDWNEAVRPLVWMACNLRFPLGQKRGKRFFLSPFQAYDLMCLFGWVSVETGERLYIIAYNQIPRKNGKSTLGGALCAYMAYGAIDPVSGKTVSGVDVFIGATSLDQAEETFKRAADCLELAGHKGVKVANSKNNKEIVWKNSKIKAIPAEPKDGKLAYFTILDEYHQHKTNALKDSILSGNVSDQQSLLMMITTAGTELNSVCHEEYEKCMRILRGQDVNERYFISIYEADSTAIVSDERSWYMANPNLGVSVSLNAFRGIYENAKCSEADMITFKTKNLNQWVRGTTRFFRMPVWEEKCRWTVDEEWLVGKKCWCGLDLSSVYDFTSFSMDFPVEGGHVILSHFWVAGNQAEAIARQCRIPLRQWEAQGYVTFCDGDTIDYMDVCDYLQMCHDTYALQLIAVDQWHIDRIETLMPSWFGELEIEFSQHMKTMSQALHKFERAYMEGSITANANPVMDWMISCADVKSDGNNVKLVKPIKSKSSTRIDGVITSLMAYDTADTHAGEDNSLDPTAWKFF